MDTSTGNFKYSTSYKYFNGENKEKRGVTSKAPTGLREATCELIIEYLFMTKFFNVMY
jgi:hypothetical protein